MEYPPAFRLQDKHPVNMISGTWQNRQNMNNFFKRVSDTVIRVQLRTDSIQFFIPSKK